MMESEYVLPTNENDCSLILRSWTVPRKKSAYMASWSKAPFSMKYNRPYLRNV